ncbi:hypothetical protein [Candidatus Endoriftia persephone]|jgi:hypothetical protein|nr:hypothetical protein [Candidatus Endoriftia persephone]KRT58297.1 hypothetical protein Ga0076813_13172 [endosymbiont of Ridgeia piscesae]USF86719.1 hypothetical protein L0Y14_11295 [Candidatus Endoriftia persephone]
MRNALLIKVAFWLVLIGMAALLAPSPAWPEWLARMVLSTGVALGLTAVGIKLWERRKGG